MHSHRLALLALIAAGAATAHAESDPELGAAHSVVLSADLGSIGGTAGPAVDVFVAPGLSLGAQLGFTSLFAEGPTTWGVSARGRIGYAVHLGDGVALWPRIGVDYDRQTSGITDPAGNRTLSAYTVRLDVAALLTFQVGTRVFVGLGPRLFRDLASGNDFDAPTSQLTRIELESTIGGWL